MIGVPNRDEQGRDRLGATYLILGSANPQGGSLATATAKWTGEAAGDHLGISISVSQTTELNPFPILAITSSYTDYGGQNSGAVYLIQTLGL